MSFYDKESAFNSEEENETSFWSIDTFRQKVKALAEARRTKSVKDAVIEPRFKDLPDSIDFSDLIPFLLQVKRKYRENGKENAMVLGASEEDGILHTLGEPIVGNDHSVEMGKLLDEFKSQVLISVHNHPGSHSFYAEKDFLDPLIEPEAGNYFSFFDLMRLRYGVDNRIPDPAIAIINGEHILVGLRTSETPLYQGKQSTEMTWRDLRIVYRLIIFQSTVLLGMLGNLASDLVQWDELSVSRSSMLGKAALYINRRYCKKFKIGLYLIKDYEHNPRGIKIT